MADGSYTVSFSDGTVAFLSGGDYAGVKANGEVSVTGLSENSLRINAKETETVNVVIEEMEKASENRTGDDIFTCIGTDITVDDSNCDVMLKDGKLTVNTEDDQKIDVSVETELSQKEIEDISTDDLENGYTVAVKKLSSLSLNTSSVQIKVGEEATLTASYKPSDLKPSLVWDSTNKQVVTVDANGKIKGINAGTAQITVKADGLSAVCSVTVIKDNTVIDQKPISSPDPGAQTGEKQAQTIKVKKTKYTVKYKTVKKKAQKINLKPVFNKGAAHGKVTYKITKYPKGGKKYIKVNKKGQITLKKKAKKGTYKVKISVAATPKLSSVSKTITIRVK